MTSLNHTIFLALNGPADPSAPVLLVAILCAKYLFLLVPLHMALAWTGGTAEVRNVALAGLCSLVLALLASGLIGAVFDTPRPQVLGIGHTLVDHRASAAFPSNHAIVCLAWASTLAIHGRVGLTAAFGLLGALVAWSRIYLGIHFPADMVGAVVVAMTSAAATARWVMPHGRRLLALSERVHATLFGRGPLRRLATPDRIA